MNNKQKQLLKAALVVIFVISALFNVTKCLHKSSILITNLPNKEIYFNANGSQFQVNDPVSGTSMQKLEPGTYILYYDENPAERWYATMRIKKDDKEVKVTFRKHELPHTKKKLILKDKTNAEDVELGNKTWRYSIYNKKNNDINYGAEINFSLRGKRIESECSYTAKWWLNMNGSNKGKEIVTLNADENKTLTIYEDKLHKIEVVIITSGNSATFELNSVLAKYITKN